MLLTIIPDATCVALCLAATVCDLRSRQIPNRLTVPGILAGLVLNATIWAIALGVPGGLRAGLLSSLSGGVLLFVAFALMGLFGLVGMGDVKLMAAVGTLLGWPTALFALAYVALAGGVVAMGYALATRALGQVFRNIAVVARRVVPAAPRAEQRVELHRVPYALAILLGATWAAAIKYVPALRIP